MACSHCGWDGAIERYTLRFSPPDREPVDVKLHLCEGCLEELLADSDTALIEPALAVAPGDGQELEDYR